MIKVATHQKGFIAGDISTVMGPDGTALGRKF